MDEHTRNIALAYGVLWHVVSRDPAIRAARHALRDRLTHAERGKGIAMAKHAACLITMRDEADRAVDARACTENEKRTPGHPHQGLRA